MKLRFYSNENVAKYYKKRIRGFYYIFLCIPIVGIYGLSSYSSQGWHGLLLFLIVMMVVFGRILYFQIKRLKYVNKAIDYLEIDGDCIKFTTLAVVALGGLVSEPSNRVEFDKNKIVFKADDSKDSIDQERLYMLSEQGQDYYIFRHFFDDFELMKQNLERYGG